MRRKPLNRSRFSKKFKRRASRTRAINLAPQPQRGGYKL